MLKNILNLEGAQQLTNNEQKSINGGLKHTCNNSLWCTDDRNCLALEGETAICFQGCCALV